MRTNIHLKTVYWSIKMHRKIKLKLYNIIMGKGTRLSKLARELNVGISTIAEFLNKKGVDIDQNPNSKLSAEHEDMLRRAFSSDYDAKKQSEKLNLRASKERKQTLSINDMKDENSEEDAESNEKVLHIKDVSSGNKNDDKHRKKESKNLIQEKQTYKVVGKIDLDNLGKKDVKEKEKEEEKNEVIDKKQTKPDNNVKDKKEQKKNTEENEKTQKETKETKETKEEKTKKTVKKETEEKQKDQEKDNADKENQVKTTEKNKDLQHKEEIDKKVVDENENNKNNQETSNEEDENKDGNKVKVLGKINLDNINQKTRPDKKKKKQRRIKKKTQQEAETTTPEKKNNDAEEENIKSENTEKHHNIEDEETDDEQNFLVTKVEKLSGPTVVGKIDLPKKKSGKKKPVASSTDKPQSNRKRRKRKRVQKKVKSDGSKPQQLQVTKKKDKVDKKDDKNDNRHSHKSRRHNKVNKKVKRVLKKEVNEEDVQKQIKETLARLTSSRQKNKSAKYRRSKRDQVSKKQQEELEKIEKQKNVLKVTEFVSVNELANMMSVPVNEVISVCLNLGLAVAINQRLDAETISVVAEEFGYKTEFVSVQIQENIDEEEDKEEDLRSRAPIVTVMGHVDHGKTKLLDHIRNTNVIAGEAGGITQHIGAYSVEVEKGKKITFLDTPGHEAFTAMRARGAQVTDIAIIVVAADDSVMPQTVEAINHAAAAGVPIVFAINKIDKPNADTEKIKEQLAKMNYLVEEWGGKYQSQDISAKNGINIEMLLEKVLLEAEMLELKANPSRNASGTIIESTLEKGRGYVTTVLVENGTLKIGDVLLAGIYTGKVKAMYNERDKRVESAGPAEPVLLLGLNGAPQAGDKFNILDAEKEARDIATKRGQLQREQSMRAQKHITLDEIGRRIAIGNFRELNIIVKGDVDGSIEALSDALIKLSNEEIQVNIIHKAVGQIIESDIMLAAASNAIIVGFQVRPSLGARRIAENEGIDIRLYSIIYDAINEVKDAMQGMLSPELKEEILGTAEVREVFKISKVGTVAGCMVKDGKIHRNSKVRLIREGIVVYTGDILALKRFKEDVKEVKSGFECGISIEKFNDIKEGDTVEAFRQVEVERKL